MAPHRLSALAFAFTVACSAGTTLTQGDGGTRTVNMTPEPGGDAAGALDGSSGGDGSCFGDQPASQGPSQPCCVTRGIDACGADLFCAALDGRTQATCYPNRSRSNGETCTADVQCAGGQCNAQGVCQQATATNDGGGTGKCVSPCATNLDCQNSCPALPNVPGGGSAVQCCDTVTSVCFGSLTPTCPGP